MRKKKENFVFFFLLMDWHGRAIFGTGRAKLLEFFFFWVWTGMAVPSFWSWPPILFYFRIILGQIPVKQIKITQNKQNKSN